MFEKIVQKILSPILSEYVQDFNAQNMKIGLWSGEVVIKNVKLRKEIIKKLNLPLNLKYSRLGCLKMTIPWKSLGSSKIDIVIEGLELLITQLPQNMWECKNHQIIEHRKKQLISYCDTIIQQFVKKSATANKDEEEKGFFGGMVAKIIDNIQVTIKDIHIRYEDQISHRFSFGITLEQLKIYTVNKNGEPEFVDRSKPEYQNQPLRKKLILSNFGIYWNQRSQFYKAVQPHQQMLLGIARAGQPVNSKVNYLILMSSQALLYQRDAGKQYVEPQINLFIQFDILKVKISNQQLQQIVTLSERLQSYMNQVKAQNRKKLTQQQMVAYHKQFLRIFPSFFEKKISAEDQTKMENILQKMEVDNFKEGIKSYLKEKQKEKMVQQKLDKKKGWFSFSTPKQLTQQQMKEVEAFVKDNFGTQTSVIKRPVDFYYIKVNFSLRLLNLAIANTNLKKNSEQGLSISLQQIKMSFGLREGGYLLNFGMDNILIDLYSKDIDKAQFKTKTNILKKMPQENLAREVKQYISLKVIGSPLEKKHLDTEIVLTTEQVLVQFDPRMIKVAQDFANVKISSQNTQAAIQTYGDIKNKVSEAATSAASSITTTKKKTFLSLDVTLRSMNLILFFDPTKTDKDVWVIDLGETRIFSDPETLKKTEFTKDQAMQKYCMKTSKMSMIHYTSRDLFFEMKLKQIAIDPKQKILDDLGIDFEIEMFQQSTQKTPKIRAKTIMHHLNLNLSSTTFGAIQKIGNCFTLPAQIEIQEKKQVQKQKANQKSEVMKQSKKIGIIYQQSKQPKKYIAVLSGSYLYLYLDKKDVQYNTYYYVKQTTLTKKKQEQINKKPFSLIVENSVNKFVLGFDKEQAVEDWAKVFRSLNEENQGFLLKQAVQKTEQKVQQAPKKQEPVDPNNLNFQVVAKIENISVKAILSNEKRVAIDITSLSAKAKLHEAKTIAKVSLKSIQISDNIYQYKYKELDNFLYTTAIQGKEKLIEIHFQQITSKHPQYAQVDANITMEMGSIKCNYKAETVQSLMLFFLPKTQPAPLPPSKPLTQDGKKSSIEEHHDIPEEQIKKKKIQKLKSQVKQGKPQIYGIKLNLKIGQISIALVNRKSKTMFSKIGLTNFRLLFGQSSLKMTIQGGIQQLWVADYSNYPQTIIEQQAQYTKFSYLVQSFSKKRDMVTFDIKMLELPNQAGKTMLIKSNLNDLKVSFNQQPVLRLITYLTEQLLPSLTPDSDPSKPKPLPVNDTKPQNSPMEIIIDLQNILAIVQPRTGEDQYLQLLIKNISVRNNSFLRPFIKQPTKQDQKVLVQNYDIRVNGISMMAKYKGKEHKLTNDLSIQLSCDLVQNSAYYLKTYNKRYDAGMRISCKLTPFLFRINHDDFNFIMKCLFWNVTFDDNAEGYLFDGPPKQVQQKSSQNKELAPQQPPSEPMYITVTMDRIILTVIQNELPLSVLLLGNLSLNLNMSNEGMRMLFEMKNLYGTSVLSTSEQNVSLEKGMFNLFGFQRKLNTKELYDIDSLINVYSVEQINKLNTITPIVSDKPAIFVEFQSNKFGDTFINMRIQALRIAIQLRNLLILSKLAIMEDNIQPPKPTLKPKVVKKVEPPPPNSGKTIVNIEMQNFLGCLSDKTGKNYIVMEGGFLIKLKMDGAKPEQDILAKSKQVKQGRFLDAASHVIQMKHFSFYFCNINDLKNKRYILLPIKLVLVYQQFYGVIQNVVVLQTQIDGKLDKIIVECSVRDMLMINTIIQDNLQTMSEQSKAAESKADPKVEQNKKKAIEQQPAKSEISNLRKEQQVVDKQAIKKTVKEVEKKIKTKMQATVELQPMQVRVVNDCNNNFMPVINFITQQTKLLYSGDAIKNLLSVALTLKLDFFNARSANWQPIIENFQILLSYLNVVNTFGSQTRIMIQSSLIQQFKQLKINVSTQLISTLLATIDIAKSQKKKIAEVKNVNQIEVSPYIIENQTNQVIKIQRIVNGVQSTVDIAPLFKGPIKLTDKAESLTFIYKNKKFTVGLEKYGLVTTPGLSGIHLDFKMDKLNRDICFMNNFVVKNATFTPIYCMRYYENKQPVQEYILMQPGEILPVQKNWFVKFSFNLKSFTQPVKATDLQQTDFLRAESQKFKLVVNQKRVIMNHSIILLRSPFMILNCLPKDMQIQFISGGKQVSSKQIKAQGSHEVFANQDVFNLNFKIMCDGFYWSQQFGAESQYFGRQCLLYLSDRERGGTSIKYIFQKDQKRMQYRLNIFCPAFLVSELDYDIQIYSNLDRDQTNQAIQKYYKLGGQSQFWRKQTQALQGKKIDKITLVGAESGSKVRVCGTNCLVDFSQPISTKNIGVSQTRIVFEKQVHGKTVCLFTVLGVQVQLRKMAMKADIFSRQITLRSRWIFSNNSEYNLQVKEQGGDKFYYQIDKGEKKPFYFIVPQLKQKPKGLIFRTQGSNESVPIMVNGLGAVYFRLQHSVQANQYLYFKLNIQQVQSYLYYEITQVKYENLPYQVVVKSQRLQAYSPFFQQEIRKGSPPLMFINEIPDQPYNLDLWIRPIGGSKQEEVVVEADNLNYKHKMRMYEEGVTQVFIPAVVYVIFSDSKKYIVVDELQREQEQIPEVAVQTINFKLQKISISIIQNHQQIERPFESFYFYMQNLQFIMDQTNKHTRYQAKLQFLQFDQDQPYNLMNPVIITPIKFKQFTSNDPKDKPKSIFNALVEIDNSFVKNMFINQIVIDINDLVVKIGSPFIKLIMQIVKQYQQAAKAEQQYYIEKKINTWKQISIPPQGSKTFIKAIRIAPFTVDVSAQIRMNQLDTESVVIFGTIINALGVVITNIEDAPIVFDGIAINDCVDSLQGLNNKLIEHYKSSVLKQLYKIFGSLNIIGNPVSLFRNISTGFKDLKEKPSQGFVEGPLEFGKGLAEGTSSLIAHSVGGALNSVQKMTGAVASGLAALTFDKQFEQKREKQKMKKPKHVIDGLQKGGKAVFHGFKEGITGLFMKPIENTKKEGVLGFFKGTAQGLAGLVVKPVTGVVDFASKTTEGLKNTALYLQDKPNENRIRDPRVLYTETGMVRQYDPIDSKLFAIINKIKYETKYNFEDAFFMESFKLSERQFLVVLSKNVVLVNIEDEKIVWNVPMVPLKKSRRDERSVTVEGPPQNQQFWQKSVSQVVQFGSKQEADVFEHLIQDLKLNLGSYDTS